MLVSHFAISPESVKKVRDEFEYFMEDKVYEDVSLQNKTKKEIYLKIQITKKLNMTMRKMITQIIIHMIIPTPTNQS